VRSAKGNDEVRIDGENPSPGSRAPEEEKQQEVLLGDRKKESKGSENVAKRSAVS